jgi:hypothetical protein
MFNERRLALSFTSQNALLKGSDNFYALIIGSLINNDVHISGIIKNKIIYKSIFKFLYYSLFICLIDLP